MFHEDKVRNLIFNSSDLEKKFSSKTSNLLFDQHMLNSNEGGVVLGEAIFKLKISAAQKGKINTLGPHTVICNDVIYISLPLPAEKNA